MVTNKLYTVAQVADLLSVSKQTVRHWDKNGKLKAIRHPINDYRMYPENQILALTKDISADVCVIGAGFVGIGAALTLASMGVDVVVVDSGRIAGEASGRNGGQFHTGWRWSQLSLEKKVGIDGAKKLWRIAENARHFFHDNRTKYNIDCDWQPGLILTGHNKSAVKELVDEANLLRLDYNDPAIKVLNRQQLADHIGSDRYLGGTIDDNGGHLHPLKYALGLAMAAKKHGARFYEFTKVEKTTFASRKYVHTTGGKISCDHIIQATNAFETTTHHQLPALLSTLTGYVIASEPLGDTINDLLPTRAAIADSHFMINYWRRTKDERILFGGGEAFNGNDPDDIGSFVHRRLTKIYPQLRDIKIDYAWGGQIGITMQRLPMIKNMASGFWFVGGFSGQGVMLAPYFGYIAAKAVTGDYEYFNSIRRLPFANFPGGVWLRQPALNLALRLAAWGDKLSFR